MSAPIFLPNVLQSKWTSVNTEIPCDISVYLFCFHHAGGSTSTFSGWQRLMPNNVLVVPMALPGRMKRMQEERIESMEVMVKTLCDEFFATPGMQAWLSNKRFSFFGHSLGAIIAYEVCVELQKRNVLLPENLFCCCSAPPSYRAERYLEACALEPKHFDYSNVDIASIFFTHRLPKEKFVQVLAALGGTPKEILSNPDLLDFFLPIIQSDFKLIELYDGINATLLSKNIRVVVFVGRYDKRATSDVAGKWKSVAGGDFVLVDVNGGHFVVQESEEVQKYIYNELKNSRSGFWCW